MDLTMHASFLPHDDPPAAGRQVVHCAWAVGERPRGARSQLGGGSQRD